jgi:hypothetical protein
MRVHCSQNAVIGWLNALRERQMRVGDKSIDPLFFRIRIHSMSGLRATDEKEMRG